MKNSLVKNQGPLDGATLAMPQTETAVKEVERKIAETRSSFRSDSLTELKEACADLNKGTNDG